MSERRTAGESPYGPVTDLPFVDTHVHFWDRSISELGGYGWLDPGSDPHPVMGDYEAIKAPVYLPRDFLAETRFHNVVRSVHVQAALGIPDPVQETKWLQGLADEIGHPHGIVAYADLADPNVSEVIERHLEYVNVRGIRDFRYDEYHTNSLWERGVALLAKHDLVLCDDPQIDEMDAAARIAARYPTITYCIDHAGFPKQRDDGYFERWKRGMRRLAAVPSTVVKISGLGMGDHHWTPSSLRRWVLECVDAWGVDRAFFGSNWPVDRLYSSYGDVIDAYRALLDDFTEDERKRLFAGNAERVFRL